MSLRSALGLAAKPAALLALALLAGCPKPAPEPASDAAASDAAATDASVALMALPYTFEKYTDWLQRFTVDVPSTFTKLESRPCNDQGCTAGVTFSGDDIVLTFGGGPAGQTGSLRTELASLKAAGATGVEQQERDDKGWQVRGDSHVNPAAPQRFIIAQRPGFGDSISYTLTGPLSKAALVNAFGARVEQSWNVERNRPAGYCSALPWANDAGSLPAQTFTGKLVIGQGFDAKGQDEKPFVLQIDKPVCDLAGRACWEVQATSKGAPDLKSFVDKQVEVTGEVGAQKATRPHRPILLGVTKITAK